MRADVATTTCCWLTLALGDVQTRFGNPRTGLGVVCRETRYSRLVQVLFFLAVLVTVAFGWRRLVTWGMERWGGEKKP